MLFQYKRPEDRSKAVHVTAPIKLLKKLDAKGESRSKALKIGIRFLLGEDIGQGAQAEFDKKIEKLTSIIREQSTENFRLSERLAKLEQENGRN